MVVQCEDLLIQTRGGGDAAILKYRLGYSLLFAVLLLLSALFAAEVLGIFRAHSECNLDAAPANCKTWRKQGVTTAA